MNYFQSSKNIDVSLLMFYYMLGFTSAQVFFFNIRYTVYLTIFEETSIIPIFNSFLNYK